MDPKNSGGLGRGSLWRQVSNSRRAKQKASAAYSEAAAARPAPYSFAPTASERADASNNNFRSMFRGTENPFSAAEHESSKNSPATVIPNRSLGSTRNDTEVSKISAMPEIPQRTAIYTSDATSARSASSWRDKTWGRSNRVEEDFNLSQNSSKTDFGTSAPAHLKDTSPTTDSDPNVEAWRKYHTAWQDYYQNYYNNYYSNAARQYIAKERLKDARARADDANLIGEKIDDQTDSNSTKGNQRNQYLRNLIRRRATDSAKKTRKIRRFVPLIVGLAVTFTILFMQYNRMIFAPIMAYVSPGNAPASSIEAVDPTITQAVSADPRLIIPKLNIDVPIRFGISLSEVMEAMNNGVAHYRIPGASAYPGQIGNFIITGHSAGDVYSSNPYKYIFSGLERLQDGDLIYVNYNSVRYTYRVIKKEVIEPTNVAALVVSTDKPLLTLVTCTPVGTSRYRLLVTAEQISPATVEDSSSSDVEQEETGTTIDEAVLPSNEPTFFENVWNFLTGQS